MTRGEPPTSVAYATMGRLFVRLKKTMRDIDADEDEDYYTMCVKRAIRQMRDQPDDNNAQQKGCHTLWSLSVNDAKNKRLIGTHGGTVAILDAMRAHPNSANVQKKACGALGSLAANDPKQKKRIVKHDGISLILQAMARHSSDASVQENGRRAMRLICPSEAAACAK